MSTPDDDWMDSANHDQNPFSDMDERPQPTLRPGGPTRPRNTPSTQVIIAVSVALAVVVAVAVVVAYQVGASSCIPTSL